MTPRVRRYSKEEFARRGEEIYARVVRPKLTEDDVGKFVTVDIESEDYEMDANSMKASDRLLARRPDAQMYQEKVGYVASYSFGGGPSRRAEL